MAQNNTTQDGAWEATVGPTTHAYNSGLVSNAGYQRDYDGDVDEELYRHAWWRYRPVTAGSTSVSANGSVPGSGAVIKLLIFKMDGGFPTPVIVVSQSTVHNLTVAPGDVYFFVIEQDIDTVDSNYWLNVSGQVTAKPVNDEAFYRTNVIVEPAMGSRFEAAPTPTDQLTISTQDPNNSGTLQRDAWWKITLAASGNVVVTPRRVSGFASVVLVLYTFNPTTNTYDWFDECEVGNTKTLSGLPNGFKLYAQMCVVSVSDATVTYRLSITSPRAIEPNNHQYDDAYVVTFLNGVYFQYVDTSTLTAAETPPPGLGAGIQGTKGAWYKLRPATTGVYSSAAEGNAVAPGTYLGLYSLNSAGTWATVQVRNLGNGGILNAFKLLAGTTYYWRTSDTGAGSQFNILTITQQPKAPNHQYANALPVESDAPTQQESVFTTPDWDVSDLVGAPETAPPGVTLSGNCAIWYTIVASTSKDGNQNPFDIQAYGNDSTGATGQLQMWAVSGGVWTSVKQSTAVALSNTSGPALSQMYIQQGTRYYIRLSSPQSPQSVRLRFRYFPPPGVEGVVSPDNHQAANAIEIITQMDGTWSETHSNVHYDAAEVLPPGTTAWGTQAMWWKYTPQASSPAGAVEFLAASETYGHTVLIYDSTVEPWVEVDWALAETPTYPNSTTTSPALTGGVQYYYRVANYAQTSPPDGAGQTMRLAMAGGTPVIPSDTEAECPAIFVYTWLDQPGITATVAVPAIYVYAFTGLPVDYINAVPPITVHAGMSVLTSDEPANVIPAITVHVTMPVNNNLQAVTVPAIGVNTRVPIPGTADASIFLSNPDPGQIVADFFPALVVGLAAADDYAVYQIEIQYGADPTFATTTSVILNASVVDGGVSYTPAAPVPPQTYWRARLLQSGVEVAPWTPTETFTVQVIINPVALPITWTVSSSAARPIHLWHFDPAGVEDGDEVTLYGQGFPTSAGVLEMNGVPITPLTWALIPANAAAPPDQRYIDADIVDAEHFAVTFIAPKVEEPGGPITVGA